MYANTTNGYRPHVTVSKEKRVIQQVVLNSTYCRLIQSITSTTEEWYGLSYADASSVCTASESSDGRPYLGSAKLTVSSGMVSQYATVDGCWGTRITSQMQRMGNTNLYQVSKTTQELSVTNAGGTLELL